MWEVNYVIYSDNLNTIQFAYQCDLEFIAARAGISKHFLLFVVSEVFYFNLVIKRSHGRVRSVICVCVDQQKNLIELFLHCYLSRTTKNIQLNNKVLYSKIKEATY